MNGSLSLGAASWAWLPFFWAGVVDALSSVISGGVDFGNLHEVGCCRYNRVYVCGCSLCAWRASFVDLSCRKGREWQPRFGKNIL